MLYGHIEHLETILRKVPKNESCLALIGYFDKRIPMSFGLQRGNFCGDIWWSTPDGETVFNRWRIAHMNPPAEQCEPYRVHPYSATAETLGAVLEYSSQFLLAGERGSDAPTGPEFFQFHDGEKRTRQRRPTSEQAEAICEIFRRMELAVAVACGLADEADEIAPSPLQPPEGSRDSASAEVS
jgi:hypothetical protein